MSAPATIDSGQDLGFERLLSEYELNGLHLRNRVVWLPHLTGYADDDGLPTSQHAAYYAERARHGVAMIITGCGTVHPAVKWVGRINAYDRRAIGGYRKISDAVHEHGCHLVGQITDDGNQQDGVGSLDWHHVRAPSAVPDHLVGVIPRPMTHEDIDDVIAHFGIAAETQREGGFDGVEVKCAHDGLHRQFLSPLFNVRGDEYGGTFENRLRFLRATVDEIRRRVGDDHVVGVRLCLDEAFDGGYGPDEGVEYARIIGTWGTVDYIGADRGAFGSLEMMNPTMAVPQGYSIELGARARASSGLPTIAFGRIKHAQMAEATLRDGHADLIGMARQLITDPEWVAKVQRGDLDDIRPCIGCNQGCVSRLAAGLQVTCILNPAAGRESRWGTGTRKRATTQRRVLVVGGGPAGLKVAEVAAGRGHLVTLVERADRLGGRVSLIRKVKARAEFGEATDFLEAQVRRLGVDVRLGLEVAAEMISAGAHGVTAELSAGAEQFDDVVIATGARPAVAGLAVTGGRVLTIVDAMERPDRLPASVIMYDAQMDQSAASAAEFVASTGRIVTIVTPGDRPAVGIGLSNEPPQLARLAAAGVEVIPYHLVDAVHEFGTVLTHAYTGVERLIEGVTDVIAAVGWTSTDALYSALRRRSAHVRRAGDCVAPRDVGMAIYSAEELGREL